MKNLKRMIMALTVAVLGMGAASAQNFDMKTVMNDLFDTGNYSPQDISSDATKGWISAMTTSFMVNGEERLATTPEKRAVDMSVSFVVENGPTNGKRILILATKTGKVLGCGTLNITSQEERETNLGGTDIIYATTMFDRLAGKTDVAANIKLEVAKFEDSTYAGTGARLFRLDIQAGDTTYTVIGQSTSFGATSIAEALK